VRRPGERLVRFLPGDTDALLRHLTNAKIMGLFVQNQRDAWKNYDKLANDPRVVFLDEPPALQPTFRDFTQSNSPAHVTCPDAYLAAFAAGCPAQLVTLDQGFRRFAGLDMLLIAE